MKIISMYLPQFHRVKENDEWWGEGYTDWVAVKKAEKIYSSHRQPNIPLDENYYDLMEKNTMKWQTDLMHKYKIDGQCFYHYWFKDGKRILERPAENLLRWKDIAGRATHYTVLHKRKFFFDGPDRLRLPGLSP